MQKGTDISKKFDEQEERLKVTFKNIRKQIDENKNKIEDLEKELSEYKQKEHKKKLKEFFNNSN